MDRVWILTDRTVRIWDVATGRQVGEPMIGHDGCVYSVGFSLDGRWIVSGSADKTIKIWENKQALLREHQVRILNRYLINDLAKTVIGFL